MMHVPRGPDARSGKFKKDHFFAWRPGCRGERSSRRTTQTGFYTWYSMSWLSNQSCQPVPIDSIPDEPDVPADGVQTTLLRRGASNLGTWTSKKLFLMTNRGSS